MSRKWLLENYEFMVDAEVAKRNNKNPLAPLPSLPEIEMPEGDYDKPYLLAMEREALGFYVTGHPLDGLDDFIEEHSTCRIADIPMEEWVTVAGVITFLEVKRTKKGDNMAVAMLEDVTGSVEIVFFPAAFAKVEKGLAEEAVVFVSGKKDDRNFIGNKLEVPDMSWRNK